jgi:hypothetical protein
MIRNVHLLFLIVALTLLTSCIQDEDLSLPDTSVSEDLADETADDMGNEPENPPTDDPGDNPTEDDSDDTPEETTDDPTDGNSEDSDCTDASSFVFQEANALLMVEFEDGVFEASSKWEFVEDNQVSGGTYGVWEGTDNFNSPGSGLVRFKLDIQNPGVYRFSWKTAVKMGDNGTEHNDSWLRFPDAADFYGEKNGSKVYPGDTGKTPNPNGSSKDGWFKVYRSGNDLGFKWQARTSDNDAHDIYVEFGSTGEYTMEVSGRSSAHAIDQFVLYQEAVYTKNEATAVTTFSEIHCNGS